MSKDFIFDIGDNNETTYFLTDKDYIVELYHDPMNRDPFECGSFGDYVIAHNKDDAYLLLNYDVSSKVRDEIANRMGEFMGKTPDDEDTRYIGDMLKFCKENELKIGGEIVEYDFGD